MQLDPTMTKIDLIYLFEANLIEFFRIFDFIENSQKFMEIHGFYVVGHAP